MAVNIRDAAQNQLLDRLTRKDLRILLESCEEFELEFDQILCKSNAKLNYAYFPLSGFISLLIPFSGHKPLELGIVGSEGMFGAALAAGASSSLLLAKVQGTGIALRISAAKLRAAAHDNPRLVQTMKLFLALSIEQLAQIAACTHFHEIDARLARWLLMTLDRSQTDTLQLTHQFLADMLGVRRSGVTIAAGKLQERNIISYIHGQITILDRVKLETVSCVCYQVLLGQYQKAMA